MVTVDAIHKAVEALEDESQKVRERKSDRYSIPITTWSFHKGRKYNG